MKCPFCAQEARQSDSFCDACGAGLGSPTAGILGAGDNVPHPGGFVGRQREMRVLKAALEDARSGQGQLVMLVGEPGIGKTRTAQELAGYGDQVGVQVLWGWCYEEAGAPPYWPWVQILRSCIQQQDPDQLRSYMGAGAADIAEIIPQVREKLPGLGPPPALEPEQARFRLFDSITNFLKNASQAQPLMLVLDDLHWADQPSLLLLEFLARQMAGSRLLVAGCYRDVELSRQHPLSETLAELSRELAFQRNLLRGLSQEDTQEFIETVVGVSPPPGLVQAIHAHTEGNPFFMTEVIRLLRGAGQAVNDTVDDIEGFRLPEGVRSVIGQRLNRRSEQCNQVLTVASVMGREFSLEQLGLLSEGLPEERLLEVVEEALNARLVEEVPGAATSYRFCHALIQETLVSELSAARQVRLHARIGEALEELYGSDVENHADELAYHFTRARPVLGPGKLVRYSLLAGEQALGSYAYEEALAHFQRGLEAKGVPLNSDQPAQDAEAAALLAGWGRVQLATLDPHQYQEALGSLTRAFNYYADVGDGDRAMAIAVYPFYPLFGQHTGIKRLIARALDLVPPDSRSAGQLLSRHARIIGVEEGNYNSAREEFARARSIAQLEGDSALEIRILADAANIDMLFWQYGESLEKNQRAIELALRVDEPHAEALARYTSVLDQLALGDLPGVRLQASAVLATAERLRDRFWLTMALRANEDVARLVGDWQTARSISDRGLGISPLECRNLCTRALLEHQTGDFDQGEAYLQRLVEVMRLTPPGPTNQHAFTAMAIPSATCISGRTDLLEISEGAAGTVLSSPFRTGHMEGFARTGLALLAIWRRDAKAAQEQYAGLKMQQGTMLPFAMIAVDRLLGSLAEIMGQTTQAMTHFESALAFCWKGGFRPELAWTCYYYADALLLRDDPGDRVRAISLLEDALSISSELGMCPLRERVVALRGQAQSHVPKGPTYPSGLTQREVEVLRLVASGKTSAEIAAELVLSRRTVEAHISNIYKRTDTHSRSEATAFAFTHGLMSST